LSNFERIKCIFPKKKKNRLLQVCSIEILGFNIPLDVHIQSIQHRSWNRSNSHVYVIIFNALLLSIKPIKVSIELSRIWKNSCHTSSVERSWSCIDQSIELCLILYALNQLLHRLNQNSKPKHYNPITQIHVSEAWICQHVH
jgi:hypothetical protein